MQVVEPLPDGSLLLAEAFVEDGVKRLAGRLLARSMPMETARPSSFIARACSTPAARSGATSSK